MTKTLIPALLLAAISSFPVAAAPGDTASTAKPAPVVGFYRGDLGHTGVSSETLAAPLSLLWRHTTQAAANNPASAITANGERVFRLRRRRVRG